MERLHEQLRESLHSLVTSEDWRKALEVAARFHDYSFANTRLIWFQALARGFDPSRVAGYRTWQTLERQVRKSERGLAILAPVTRKLETEDGDEERRVVGFRVVHVFDISQTDGEPLPEVRAALVAGELPADWGKVAELITEAGFSLQVADVERLREANGITDWMSREVVVRANLPGAQRFKTAVHELAHINLHEPNSHGRPNCRGIVEVEAESVAYVVCAALGVDSAGYSLPYVASWSGGDLDRVAATADRVIRCARQIVTSLEAERHLTRDRSATLNTTSPTHQRHVTIGEKTPLERGVGADRIEQALRSAVSFYQNQLHEQDGTDARTLLQERGFTGETVDRWQLGYAPPSWDSLTKALRHEGIPDEDLLAAGLAGRARTGRLYDRMRGRIIFPVLDAEGSPRGFAGRLVTGDGPKYLNSPETLLYKKSSLLYGLHLARPTITERQHAVIVEGYTDAIAAHQVGIDYAVATGGTAVTAHHLSTLQGMASTITLTFDGDGAGAHAVERMADPPTGIADGAIVRVARLPAGSDPASLVETRHPELLRAAIADSVPLIHYLMERIVSRYNLDEPEAVARALHAAGALVAHLADSRGRADAITYLAELVQRNESLVELALADQAPVRRQQHERRLGPTLS